MLKKTLLGVVRATRVHLGKPTDKPFFRAILDLVEGRSLHSLIDHLAHQPGRRWYYIVSSNPDPKRLRVVDLNRTPAYEQSAAPNYLLGQVFRVSGKGKGFNINFSGPVGAGLLADRLQVAISQAKNEIELVIPNRRERDLIEFVADTQREFTPSTEHQRLTDAGAAMAASAWPAEDFSDWESGSSG